MASRKPKRPRTSTQRTGFEPIEVTPGRTTPPLVREVDFTASAVGSPVPARPAVPTSAKKPAVPNEGKGSDRASHR